MKERRLFDGEIGDSSIDVCIPKLIDMASETGEDVFLRWNGATMRITKDDTIATVMNDFNEQCHAMSLFALERNGDILHVDDLSDKITGLIKKLMEA